MNTKIGEMIDKMRNLVEVIDQMMEKIPETESEIRIRFAAIRISVCFAAPESMPLHWSGCQKLLIDYFPDPTNLLDWQQEVVNIFTGKEQ